MSERIQKVNELIKRELSQIILREMNFPRDVLVTIIKVATSSDLSLASIYISVIPSEKTKKIVHDLKKNIYNLQQLLNKRLRMRPIPKIRFLEERGTSEAEKIEQIFEKIKVEKQEEVC